ncbi:MAG TPA: outer membrane lipoprotein carrier protein LolA [Terriglobia bacterium]|nr:outer membrane lipoprotein carrier protein LolA [Terriglobia bacterium]
MGKNSKHHKVQANPHRVKLLVLAGIGLLILPSFLPGSSSPERLPLDQFIKEVQKSYHGVHALRAGFKQTYTAGGRTRVESGTVVFARGGRMRWDYREPSKKIFLSDGKEVLLYLPDENQLDRSSLKASEDFRVPFRLLLSRVNLRKVFSKFEDAGEALQHDPGDRVIRAYPKHGEKAGYQRVVIEFDPQLDIRRLELVYIDNSVMKFSFDPIDRNPRFSASLFHFTPPPGTQIIAHH